MVSGDLWEETVVVGAVASLKKKQKQKKESKLKKERERERDGFFFFFKCQKCWLFLLTH